jgi:1,4-dihydroxy-6-naphthoate synthase
MPELTLGYSPCPNDTHIFHALVHGYLDLPFRVRERLEDVETLNRLVLRKELDISKVSYHLFGHARDNYCLLRSGGALGRGCGPLLVSTSPVDLDERPVAVPGEYTTAALLLRMFHPGLRNLVFMPFDDIMPKVLSGEVAAGVIIHESRFTYQALGLKKLVDLGQWWEETTGSPIPLGGIVVRRSLGKELIRAIEQGVAASAAYAKAHPAASREYIRAHAQEMSEEVCSAHINLYVNDFTLDMGDEGIRAVENLFSRGEAAGIIPRSSQPLFAE